MTRGLKTGNHRPVLTVTLAFAAGVAVGVFGGRSATNGSVGVDSPPTGIAVVAGEGRHDKAALSSGKDGGAGDRSRLREAVRRNEPESSEPVVEITYDDTPVEASSEITEAHRVRQEKRALARAERADKRRDFLASLNLELLTVDQQKLHTEYAEAVAVRDAVKAEIRALRAKGDEVPENLHQRLSDAESVVRADVADEHRILREAATRARGLDETESRALLEDLASIDSTLGWSSP